jgi:hypothetical protein
VRQHSKRTVTSACDDRKHKCYYSCRGSYSNAEAVLGMHAFWGDDGYGRTIQMPGGLCG